MLLARSLPFVPERRWFRVAACAAFALAAVARIGLRIHFTDFHSPELWEFGEIARNLVQTGTFTYRSNGVPSAFMPPGYPLYIAFLYQVFGVGEIAHVILAGTLLVFELCLPFLVGYLAAEIRDRTTGFVAFLLALFWPQLLVMSGRLTNIPIYTSLLLLACVLVLANSIPLRRRAFLSGLALGMFGLFRFEACAFLVPFGFVLFRHKNGSGSRRAGVGWRRRLGILSVFLGAFLIPLLPWIGRNYAVFGEVVLSTSGGYNLRRGHHARATGTAREHYAAENTLTESTAGGTPVPGADAMARVVERTPGDVLEVDRFFRDEALRFIAANPAKEASLAVRKLFFFLVADFTHPMSRVFPIWGTSFVALMVGLVHWFRSGIRDPRQQFLWLVFATQACLAVAFFVVPRYRMGVEFVPLVFFAAALDPLVQHWSADSTPQQKEAPVHRASPSEHP
ncbi:MAG TPA: hypothetical protein PLV10_02425 [Candidatus Latescibacteria bacterium]|nr:hypothetical protein [Candidatus Latescibacterota bacterium]